MVPGQGSKYMVLHAVVPKLLELSIVPLLKFRDSSHLLADVLHDAEFCYTLNRTWTLQVTLQTHPTHSTPKPKP